LLAKQDTQRLLESEGLLESGADIASRNEEVRASPAACSSERAQRLKYSLRCRWENNLKTNAVDKRHCCSYTPMMSHQILDGHAINAQTCYSTSNINIFTLNNQHCSHFAHVNRENRYQNKLICRPCLVGEKFVFSMF
jgi:hypothetical protein